ncbi:metalloregulator ArsR/SmtB family transcription factor [Phytomonospora sp. NPDC050363]|uniref:ArsR/SmtB family transcription factor n=1 Tax=Phytomonospora sp. NPDC050363 TaxID=3155642 RepID=UPI0033CED625
MGTEESKRQIEILKAMAHPIRLGVLRRLATDPDTCACDFTEVFGVAQPTISAHLRTLREAGLVTTRREGTTICYSLAPDALRPLTELLGELMGAPVAA